MAKKDETEKEEKQEDVKAQKADDKPQNADEKPQAADEKPEATDEKSEDTNEKPEATDEKPQATDEKPEATDEKSEDTDEKPEAADKAEKTDEKAAGSRLLPWILTAAIVLVFAGAGFGLGRFLAGSRTPKTAEPSQENNAAGEIDLKADSSSADSQKGWYYVLNPVVANLDVPGVTRYVRATLILEISAEVDEKKCIPFLEQKTPLLTNWLTIYLAGLSLDDIRGDSNLRRIQAQVLDAFNEKLFPDAKPQIKKILFKEFAIQ
ncbi:MAG: flagellar basal body-associated FliL family protein [Planctomycetota bacterium]|jgi:flagellar basal body-associated protein FliL